MSTSSTSPPSPPSPSPVWHSLNISPSELRCDVTLTNGQCFGWRKHPTLREWTGVLDHTVLTLRQTPTDTLYTIHHPPSPPLSSSTSSPTPSSLTSLLRDYFFLDRVSLSSLYSQWSADRRFASIAPHLLGLRLLRQEPLECLVSFICSSANNIPRITSMLHTLRTHYGEHLITLPPHPTPSPASPTSPPPSSLLSFHAFPTLERLASLDPLELRSHGFGYRADYVTNTAAALVALGGLPFLHALRLPSTPTTDVLATLQTLPGVGPKVAACAALFSLDRLDLVPVDTHVHALALRDYGEELSKEVRGKGGKAGGVTKRVREEVEALLREKFGEYAGWAHSVLFTAELPSFRHRFAVKVEKEGEGEGEGEEAVVTETVVVKVEQMEEVVQEGRKKRGKVKVEEVEEGRTVGKAQRRGKRKSHADKENVQAEGEEPQQQPSARSPRSTSTNTTTISHSAHSSTSASSSSTIHTVSTMTVVKVEMSGVEEVTSEPRSSASSAPAALPFRVTKHARSIPRRAVPPWLGAATRSLSCRKES